MKDTEDSPEYIAESNIEEETVVEDPRVCNCINIPSSQPHLKGHFILN